MEITTDTSYWLGDLKEKREPNVCPIKGCTNEYIETRATRIPCCHIHGLEIHAKTFVYYNGENQANKRAARLRNFLAGGRSFVADHILGNKDKAESHRLGSENSEDALTWNVFGELHRLGLIHLAYNFLTGENVDAGQIELYLWGLKIDFIGKTVECCDYLKRVRNELEGDIKRFQTEPDIMLLGPSRLVVIEAKFTSGNPTCIEGQDLDDEKPKSRSGLLQRYVETNMLWKPELFSQDVPEKVHSQLLRMIVFASTIAQLKNREWKVVNLVSRTQWGKIGTRRRKGYDFENPTEFIPKSVRDRFDFVAWEDLYNPVIAKEARTKEIAEYMQKKTANLSKAFEL